MCDLSIQHMSFTFLTIMDYLFQIKHFRALQEQARTYLDLLCSMCDLSNSSVKATAKDIQQIEQMVKQTKKCNNTGFVFGTFIFININARFFQKMSLDTFCYKVTN